MRSNLRQGLLILSLVMFCGCSAHRAYRQGLAEAKKANWDLAVARLTRANDKAPDNIRYKLALEDARTQAARMHFAKGMALKAEGSLDAAIEQFDIASRFDTSNRIIAEELRSARQALRRREEERRDAEMNELKRKAAATRVPLPVLSPRAPQPIQLKFTDTSLKKIFEAIGLMVGVNVLFDSELPDKPVSINLMGVTFEEALEQITFVNKCFYKVIDQNTIMIIPDNANARRKYEDVILQSFYLENPDTADQIMQAVRTLANSQKVYSNKEIGALTVVGTPDQLALAKRIVEINDRPKGEVVVEVKILEVNRTKTRDYGIDLGNYAAGASLQPFSNPGTDKPGDILRANVLASLNLSDFVVTVPTSVLMNFLAKDSSTRILATPRLRAAEGKATSLNVGSNIPMPQTTFSPFFGGGNTGTGSYSPYTSYTMTPVGVQLSMTPKVTAKGEISLDIEFESSSLGPKYAVGGDLEINSIDTRKLKGTLRVRDGETSLIGGLIQSRQIRSQTGVRGIKSIPILGSLLRSTSNSGDESEIIISITPYLIKGSYIEEEDLRAMSTGTFDTIRVPGARPPLMGPPAPTPNSAPVVTPAPVQTPPPSAPRTASVPAPPQPSITPSAPPMSTPQSAAADQSIATPAPSSPTAPEAPKVTLSPSETIIQSGAQSSFSIVVTRLADVKGLDIVLTFDPAIVAIVDVAAGPLLTLDGVSVSVERTMEAGRAKLHFSRPSATNGSGIVANLQIKGIAPGATVVSISSLSIAQTGTTQAISSAGAVARVQVQP